MSFFTDKKETSRIGCKKCGFAGHLSFQCRNLIPIAPNKKPITFEGSASSEEDLNYFTPLQELNMQEQKDAAEKIALEKSKDLKRKKDKQKLKKKHKKRSKSSSSDDSDSDSSSSSSDEKYKKSKKKRKASKKKSKKSSKKHKRKDTSSSENSSSD